MQFSIAVFKHIVCNDASHQFQLSSLEFEAAMDGCKNECVGVEASKSGDVHEINFVKLMHCLISFAKNGIKTFLIWPLICFSFSNVYHLTMPLHLAEKKLSWWFILPLSV